MIIKITLLLLLVSLKTGAQKNSNLSSYRAIYESKYVQIPPAFAEGPDSCRHYYFNHFKGFDSLLVMAVENGDTAKYLRIYFSFVVDRNGFVYDARFLRIASTRLVGSAGAKTIPYFVKDKNFYNKIIQEMMLEMPLWKPALQDGVPVACKVENYLQCWVGLTAPK